MYYDELQNRNIEYKLFPFLDKKTNRILFDDGKIASKVLGVLKGFFNRFISLYEIRTYQYVYIFREASPIGPPIFEWILAKLFRKKIIYDFDDAIYLPFKSKTNKLTNSLKWTNKVKSICKWSHTVTCGNEYLATFTKQFNSSVIVIPTIVDTDNVHNLLKDHLEEKNITIGWTGSHSSNFLLNIVIPVLRELQRLHAVKFKMISNIDPNFKDFQYEFIKWSEESEIQDLMGIDIGIMPLTDDDWTKGKCGFKAIQYLSLGIPAVVSPVGVNDKIVIHGETGFLAESYSEWLEYLRKLVLDKELRKSLGYNGRNHVQTYYSKNATLKMFIDLFRN